MFELGAVVRLKSGGPRMTIIAIFPNSDEVDCLWFKASQTEHEVVMNRKFKMFSLKKVE